MSPETRSAKRKAAAVVPIQSCPKKVMPAVMAKAAPKLAAEVTPRVEGLARAFPVMFWISNPASASDVPTKSARATCRRKAP